MEKTEVALDLVMCVKSLSTTLSTNLDHFFFGRCLIFLLLSPRHVEANASSCAPLAVFTISLLYFFVVAVTIVYIDCFAATVNRVRIKNQTCRGPCTSAFQHGPYLIHMADIIHAIRRFTM